MRRVAALFALVFLIAIRPGFAQPLPVDPRIVTGKCENGLRYVVIRHAVPALRAQIWLHVGAGSLNETDDQRGAAHFLSHLAFAGSENYPADAITPLLQSLGMRNGPDLNSHSNFSETVYKLSLREATPDAVGKALAFMRDIAHGLALAPDAIETHRAIILAEQKNSASVDQRVQEFLLANLIPGSNIGNRLHLGTPQSVKDLTVDHLRAFYRQWYVPANMTVTFVGDMDAAEAVKLITSTVGAGRAAPLPESPQLNVKPSAESRGAVISDAELNTSRLYLLKGLPLQPAVASVEEFRSRVLDSMAVGAFNRRLGAKIATGTFGFEEAGSFSSDLSGICQLTGMYVTTTPGRWRDGLQALSAELQRARLHGLHANEVDETKKHFLAQAEQNVKNEPVRQAAAYTAALAAGADRGDAPMSAQQTLDQLRAVLDTLDARAVSDHFAKLMDPAGMLFMLAAPSTSQVPTDAEVLAAGVEAVKVAPAPEAAFVMPTALMTERPAAAKVVEESTHAATGVWSAWLENGVRVHHRVMTITPGQATITVALAGGTIEETELSRGLTDAAAVAWSRFATSKLPSFVIEELLNDKEVRVEGGPGIDNLLLAVTGPVDELETGMQLLHLLLTDPVIEAPGLDQWKKMQTELAAAREKQPRDVFNDAMHDLIYPESELRPRPLSKAQIDRITLEAAQGWARKQIASGPIEVSVVGDITREKAADLVATYIGSLPARPRIASNSFETQRKVDFVRGPAVVRREVSAPNSAAFVMAGFRSSDATDIAEGRLLGLAAEILGERLTAALTQPEKLVQNVLVQSQPGQEFPGSGIFGAFAPADPANAERVITIAFEAFDAFAANGPTVEEVARVKEKVAHQLETALANDKFWTAQLSLLDYRGVPLAALATAVTAYQSITPDDIKAAFARHYRPETKLQLILVQKGDATKVVPIEKPIPTPPMRQRR